MRVINTTHTQLTLHLSQLCNLFKKKIYEIKCSFKYGIKNIALSALFLMFWVKKSEEFIIEI